MQWLRSFKDGFQLDLEALEDLITDNKTNCLSEPPQPLPGSWRTGTGNKEGGRDCTGQRGLYVLIDEIFLDGAFVSQASAYGFPNVYHYQQQ